MGRRRWQHPAWRHRGSWPIVVKWRTRTSAISTMETTTKTGKERDRLERDELLQPFSSFLFIFFPRFSFYFAIRSLFFSTAALALNRWNVQTLFRFLFCFVFFLPSSHTLKTSSLTWWRGGKLLTGRHAKRRARVSFIFLNSSYYIAISKKWPGTGLVRAYSIVLHCASSAHWIIIDNVRMKRMYMRVSFKHPLWTWKINWTTAANVRIFSPFFFLFGFLNSSNAIC